ncbi:hypothetical protein [Pseudofrankia sp. BMG5.36]|uniref:hypothetical protein n=1 Tax=Pseudofrankia sp. BMG5.36 TaxID=1834512 RepID=UPI0008DAD421|nr:hypothetical protein [Pseudofrankia sp. BMG5.36]OHV61258.1 hypothetical protein BCD48_40055 [Pseudofrankia sp. BMG5.36]
MGLDLFAGHLPASANRLHLLEEGGRDERGMAPGVPDALEADFAHVVAVGEHLVDLLHAHGPARALGRSWQSQAPILQGRGQLGHRELAAGVGLEHPDDVRRPVFVDRDSADLLAALVHADVAVAEGRQA